MRQPAQQCCFLQIRYDIKAHISNLKKTFVFRVHIYLCFLSSAPCIPGGVTTNVQCETDRGSVSWAPSDGAKSYIAVATGHDGHRHVCLTNTTSCTWSDLHCGEEYTVVVRAKDSNSTSLPSNSSVIYTGMLQTPKNILLCYKISHVYYMPFFPGPCLPHNLTASVNCDMRVLSFSWDGGNGTYLYAASAEAANRKTNITTNVTTAHFSGLSCGQNYSLSVAPYSQHCPGISSTLALIQTCKLNGSDV